MRGTRAQGSEPQLGQYAVVRYPGGFSDGSATSMITSM
jgi:hypothetical protein